MNKFDELRKLLDQIVLNEIPDDLSNRVFDIVDEDCQPESFLQLIIDSDNENVRKNELFLKGIRELGWEIPTQIDAARRKAVCIMQSIVSGEVAPYEGASEIWHGIIHNFSELNDDLYIFIGFASECEEFDDPAMKSYYDNEIVKYSQELLQKY